MTNIPKKKTGLGKGLSALLESADTDVTSIEPVVLNSVAHISISQIEANPFQPRTDFDQAALDDLTESIKVHGVIQPITVRKMGYETYQIISGERRTRASIAAGLTEIPAYIRVANDQEMLEMAIIENVQREDLNPIEIALSYKRLLEECHLKQEELGERVGKNRTTVNNYLRLLRLPDDIQTGLRDEKISMGHARALINVENKDWQLEIYHRAIIEDLSVREVEKLVKTSPNEVSEVTATVKKPKTKGIQTNVFEGDFSEFANFRDLISRKFDSEVEITPRGNGKGSIVIHFENRDHFKEILKLI